MSSGKICWRSVSTLHGWGNYLDLTGVWGELACILDSGYGGISLLYSAGVSVFFSWGGAIAYIACFVKVGSGWVSCYSKIQGGGRLQ